MGIISWIILGLIAGALAKWLMPGDDGGGRRRAPRITVASPLREGISRTTPSPPKSSPDGSDDIIVGPNKVGVPVGVASAKRDTYVQYQKKCLLPDAKFLS